MGLNNNTLTEKNREYHVIYSSIVELQGGAEGPGPLKDRVAPSKHLI